MASNNDVLSPAQSKEISIKIVQMYSERPILWNPDHQYYRVTSMKLEAWQQIAYECELDVATMRRKVNSLLASYRRERSRIRRGKGSNWFLYDAMKFIPNYVPNCIPNNISSSNSTDDEAEFFVNKEELDDEPEVIYEDNEDDSVQYFDIPAEDVFVKEKVEIRKPMKMRTVYVRPEKTPPKTKFVKVRKESTETFSEPSQQIVNPIENIVYKSPNEDGKDECDVFGEYIAKSLRKHDDKTRAMIKQAINNIIYEEEMRKYDTDTHIV